MAQGTGGGWVCLAYKPGVRCWTQCRRDRRRPAPAGPPRRSGGPPRPEVGPNSDTASECKHQAAISIRPAWAPRKARRTTDHPPPMARCDGTRGGRGGWGKRGVRSPTLSDPVQATYDGEGGEGGRHGDEKEPATAHGEGRAGWKRTHTRGNDTTADNIATRLQSVRGNAAE